MSAMKTKGQLLYEHKCPSHIKVVPVNKGKFHIEEDIIWMKVEDHVPWKYLTQEFKDSMEKTAEGHSYFSFKEN